MTYRERLFDQWEKEDEAIYRRHVYDDSVRSYNIGDVFALVLTEEPDGRLHGYYKVHKTNMTLTLDGEGMTRGKILKMMWDKAREINPALPVPVA